MVILTTNNGAASAFHPQNCSVQWSKEDTFGTHQKTKIKMTHEKCFLELGVFEPDHHDELLKKVRVEVELFHEHLPKASQNFAQLCEGVLDKHDQKMCYTNSLIHQIVPGWVLVGGDFVNNNGTGGKSIFDKKEFEDESFDATNYSEPGLLCMLSHGPNTNSSIFFITLKPAEWINKLYVAFGRVTSHLEELKQLAEEYGCPSGVPKKIVKIVASGKIN